MAKILIVEDVEFNRDLLVQLLEDEHDIVTAEDGEQGIEMARRARPDRMGLSEDSPGRHDRKRQSAMPHGSPGPLVSRPATTAPGHRLRR